MLISRGPFHGDCLSFARAVEKTIETGRLHYLHSHGFPFTAILGTGLHYFLNVFGFNDPVMTVNLFSVIFSSISVVFLFILTRRIINTPAAFFTAVLFSLSPVFLGNSLYGNTHMPAMALFLGALLCLTQFTETSKSIWIYAAGLLWGLAFAARAQDIAIVSPAFLICLWRPHWLTPGKTPGKSFYRHKMAALGLGTAAILFLYWPILQSRFLNQPPKAAQGFLQSELFHCLIFDWPSNAIYTMETFLLPNFAWLGIFLIAGGSVFVWKMSWRLALILSIWIMAPLLFFSMLSILTPRLFMILLPPCYLLSGICLMRLFQTDKLRWPAAVLFLLTALFPLWQVLPDFAARHQSDSLAEYARWVKTQTEPDAVIISTDYKQFLAYYGSRDVTGRMTQRFDQQQWRDFLNRISQLLAEDRPVYITNVGLYSYDFNFSKRFKNHFRLEYRGYKPLDDYHTGVLRQTTYLNDLYRVRLKKSSD
ncbi:MAG: ArnT family glycosyltransferase [Candidatus Omnitrophota bacterium]